MKRSFDDQVNAVMDKVRIACNNAAVRALNDTAQSLASEITMNNVGFHHVTGNLWNSIGVASVKSNPKTKRKVVDVFVPSKGDGNPTRPTLRPGETLPSDKWYENPGSGKRAYKAPIDSSEPGGRDGRTERNRYAQAIRDEYTPTKGRMGYVTIFAALPYANDLDMYHVRKQWWSKGIVPMFREKAGDLFSMYYKAAFHGK